ncbi:MAG: response regulator [Solirubrobacteraceae bacterium]
MDILIVDDHEIVRDGLKARLSAAGRYGSIVAAATGAEAMRAAARNTPDVVVVDLRLPDMNGTELCRRLRARHPELTIVVLTTYLSEETVREAHAAGADAYVTKAAGVAELRLAIDRARGGHGDGTESASQIVRRLHELVDERIGTAQPTPQQTRVLELAAEGLTNREIGAQMFVAESTVRFHMQRLKHLVGARTRTELIAKAIRNGLLPPAPEHLVSAE